MRLGIEQRRAGETLPVRARHIPRVALTPQQTGMCLSGFANVDLELKGSTPFKGVVYEWGAFKCMPSCVIYYSPFKEYIFHVRIDNIRLLAKIIES